MRIISPFKDYYDSVTSLMYDSELIYVRREEAIKDGESILEKIPWDIYSQNFDIHFFIIGFCGNFFPGLTVKEFPQANKEIIYHVDSNLYKDLSLKFGRQLNRSFRPLLNSFKDYRNDEIFIANETPIIVFKGDGYLNRGKPKVTKNNNLRPYKFFRVKDPFQAHQDISMYLGGMARKTVEPKSLSDDDLRDKKGFDKYSFRKTKKK